jgi:hypothetical protein
MLLENGLKITRVSTFNWNEIKHLYPELKDTDNDGNIYGIEYEYSNGERENEYFDIEKERDEIYSLAVSYVILDNL